jgi:hypothetical protein
MVVIVSVRNKLECLPFYVTCYIFAAKARSLPLDCIPKGFHYSKVFVPGPGKYFKPNFDSHNYFYFVIS